MPHPLRALPLLLLLLASPSLAQVADDFADGDFSADPPWTGETDRFTVVPFGADSALRSDGVAASDTIHLATGADVAFGRWAFTFRYEANLTNANGTRVYLVADTPALEGDVFGYYVQIGTNNSDEVRLYRQDGPATSRTVVGASEGPIATGDEGTLAVEVLRDGGGNWQVSVDGTPVIADVRDATYSESAALGVWAKHSTQNGAAFFWDDVVADPDGGVDLGGPIPQSVTVANNGGTLLVQFDEVLAAETVIPPNFSLDNGVGPPFTATLAGDGTVAELTFAPPIPEGEYVLSIENVEDLDGNPVAPGTAIAFSFEPDDEPPELVSAEAASATRVDVGFDEAVQGCDVSLYEITPGIGTPDGIECPGEGSAYGLLLDRPLEGPQTYTVTATGVADLAGNVQPETSAGFFFGAFDDPAPGEIVINEVMFDPPDEASNEYVELYNRTPDRTFDLGALALADDNGNPVSVTSPPSALGPGEYAVLVRNADAFEAAFPDVAHVPVTNFPALNNGGDTPSVWFGEIMLDAVPYAPSWGGSDAALERRSPAGPSAVASNWATSLDPDGGTPGEPNSVPPDEAPPIPTDADLSADGLTLTVSFDEPLDPASVTPGAFTIAGGPAVSAAEYLGDDDPAVALALAEAPAPGTYTLTITGIADLLGNATDGATIDFGYDPDVTPPSLIAAAALDATTVEAVFSEVVHPSSASDPANYEISDGIDQPVSAELGNDERRVLLTLATPLTEQRQYTLTARGILDLAGNELGEDSADFFFGEGDVPQPGDLVVNEVMYDPPDTNANEYVELLNISDKTLDLSAFTFSDLTNTVRITTSPRFVLPGEYAVLVRDAEAFEAAFPGVEYVDVHSFPGLNNPGDAVVIAYEAESVPRVVTDSVRFQPSWGGNDAALERRDPAGPSNSGGNWGTSLDPRGGTPGEANSVPPDTTPPTPDDVDVTNDGLVLTVLFTELLSLETVSPGTFSIDESITPVEATYSEAEGPIVTLTLAEPLAPGSHTLTVTGVADLQGNVSDGEALAFTFNPDTEPPVLLGASAPDSAQVDVVFSEALGEAAADPGRYTISEGIEVARAELDGERVLLTLGTPLEGGVVYTLTLTDIPDMFGNVLAEASTRFLLGGSSTPEPGALVITEIMYDLPSDRNDEEYVELYNAADVPFDLSTLTLSDTGAPGALVGAPTVILPGEYVAVVADAAAFRDRFPNAENFVQAGRFPSLNNGGDAVVVRAGDAVIDSVFYDAGWQRPELRSATGIALERLAVEGPSTDGSNWTSSLDPSGGTPGAPNSVTLPPGAPPAAAGLVAEPSPFNASVGTQISYTLASDAALVRLRVFDGAGRLVRTLEDAVLGGNARAGTITWQGRDDENRPLRVGIYVLLLEALDVQGGRTEAHKAVVVLARDL